MGLAVLAAILLAACGSHSPGRTTSAARANPTHAQYARELNALCRRRLLSAATAATQKSITASSAPPATQESEIATRIARPFEDQLLAILPPTGNPTARNLRATVREDVALDFAAVIDFRSHNTRQLEVRERAQTAAEERVDADADELGATLCESY